MCLTSALPKILTEVETFGERCKGDRRAERDRVVVVVHPLGEQEEEVGTIGDRKTSQYNGTMGDNAMALGLMNARLGGGDIGEGEIWSR